MCYLALKTIPSFHTLFRSQLWLVFSSLSFANLWLHLQAGLGFSLALETKTRGGFSWFYIQQHSHNQLIPLSPGIQGTPNTPSLYCRAPLISREHSTSKLVINYQPVAQKAPLKTPCIAQALWVTSSLSILNSTISCRSVREMDTDKELRRKMYHDLKISVVWVGHRTVFLCLLKVVWDKLYILKHTVGWESKDNGIPALANSAEATDAPSPIKAFLFL